jgi:hypothetical protein
MTRPNVAIQRKRGKKSAARKGDGAAKPGNGAGRAEAVIKDALQDAHQAGARAAAQQVATQFGMTLRLQGKDGAVETIEPEPAPDQDEQDARSSSYAARDKRRAAFEAELAAEGDGADGLREALGMRIFASYEDGDDTLLLQVSQSLADDLEIPGDGVREGTLGESNVIARQLWRLEQRARFGLLVAGCTDADDDAAESEAVS